MFEHARLSFDERALKLFTDALELEGVNLASRSDMISNGTPFPSDPSITWLMKSFATTFPLDLFHVG